MKSVVLLSGGVDSTTCLAIALADASPTDVVALSASYGQKHSGELEHAVQVATHYGVDHRVLEIAKLFGAHTSTLLQGGPANPMVSYEELDEGVSPAYVPF